MLVTRVTPKLTTLAHELSPKKTAQYILKPYTRAIIANITAKAEEERDENGVGRRADPHVSFVTFLRRNTWSPSLV